MPKIKMEAFPKKMMLWISGLYAVHFIFAILWLSTPEIVFPKLYPDKSYVNNTGRRVFFGLVTMPGDKRQDWANAMWLSELNKYTPHEGVFICKEGKELPDTKYLHPSKEDYEVINRMERGRSDRDRAMKRYIGAKYFYENTDYDWYWSATDDVYIDIQSLDNFLDYLTSRYDPRKDVVFKSHLIYHLNLYFPQGGSGYIFSRKAVEKFLEFGLDFVKQIITCDDCEFWRMRYLMNLTIKEMSTQYIFGRGCNLKHIRVRSLMNPGECPLDFPVGGVYDEPQPIKDMVAYHSIYDYYHGYRIIDIASRKNKYLHYYIRYKDLVFCNVKETENMSISQKADYALAKI